MVQGAGPDPGPENHGVSGWGFEGWVLKNEKLFIF